MTVPLKAEEGISGLLPLDRKPEPPSQDELIGGTLSPESIALNMQDVKTIDLEGRTTIVDLGLFVLINVYCPNETNEERLDFKLAFNAMLEARILNLISLGREVIVLGDLNICRNPIDHCDPVRRMKDSSYAEFGDHPARKWLNEFVNPQNGVMVDLGRHFYPERKSMFTHWETRINARETNYGTRIDYILATPGLLPWVKACEIQPNIIGSDHCPVVADFHESIITPDGGTEYLWDKVNPPGRSKDPNATPPEPPRLAAKFYPEFGAEQRLLSNFFKKPPASTQQAPLTAAPSKRTAQATSTKPPSSISSSGNANAKPSDIVPLAPLPSSLVADDTATTSKQAIIDLPQSAPSPSAKNEIEERTKQVKTKSQPLASPSIDLTLDPSDDDIGPVNGKNGTKKSDKKNKGSSVISSPAPSANGSGRTITKPKGKNGQQTLATFFKPPTPAPSESHSSQQRKSSKSTKGKGRASEDLEDLSSSGLTASETKNIDEPGDVIVSSDDENSTDDIQEDQDSNDLKKKASKGSRGPIPSEGPPSHHKKRKSRDVSADGSTDSDIQDVRHAIRCRTQLEF